MVSTKSLSTRLLWICLMGVCLWSVGLPMAWAQAIKANVEFSNISQKDPHPTTYSWDGEITPVTDPGPYFYYFFYLGTVNPDARVPEDTEIKRIPIPTNEWVANRKFLISKLTLFYQISGNMEPTALKDLQSLQQAPEGAAPGGEGSPSAATPTPTPTPTPSPTPARPGIPPRGMYGQGGGQAQQAFDPKAAAEWTFYYDQLVLWEYYCSRNLLNKEDTELLEPELSEESETPQTQQQMLLEQAAGVSATEGDTVADLAKNYPAGKANVSGTGGPGGPGGQGSTGGQRGYGAQPRMTPAPVRQRAAAAVGAAGKGIAEQAAVREMFDAVMDYQEPDEVTKTYDKFIGAAKKEDQLVYEGFMDMLGRIDDRDINQQQYNQWLETRRKEIAGFADTWRQLKEGDVLMVEDTLFLVTKEPMESAPIDTVNVVQGKRLTPQDMLNPDGTVRQPKAE